MSMNINMGMDMDLDFNLYVINTPYGYMIGTKELDFVGIRMDNISIFTMKYELHNMCLKIVSLLYIDENRKLLTNDFVSDAMDNYCDFIVLDDDKFPVPYFDNEDDAKNFRALLEARKILYTINS